MTFAGPFVVMAPICAAIPYGWIPGCTIIDVCPLGPAGAEARLTRPPPTMTGAIGRPLRWNAPNRWLLMIMLLSIWCMFEVPIRWVSWPSLANGPRGASAVLGSPPVLPRLRPAQLIRLPGPACLFTARLFPLIRTKLFASWLRISWLLCPIGAMRWRLGLKRRYLVFTSQAPIIEFGLMNPLVPSEINRLLALRLCMDTNYRVPLHVGRPTIVSVVPLRLGIGFAVVIVVGTLFSLVASL